MSIMAARNDRALRTASEVLVGQCRALAPESSGLAHGARARMVVLIDDLLNAVENPTNARNQSWSTLLERRFLRRSRLDDMTQELAATTSSHQLQRLCASRTANLASTLSGPLPVSISNDCGNSHLVDMLRATLLELCTLAVGRSHGHPQPAALRACVRALSQALGERFPGQTIEVRIPPASAVQVGAFGEGPTHTRGTPPNVVETDESTWFQLAVGLLSLDEALESARATASGSHYRALERMLPVIDLSTIL